MVLKWGICCVGYISQDFTSAFKEYPNSSREITAVAARNIERAKEFSERFNIKNYFGSYEELAKFSDIDIVYIGSIHPEHCRLTKLFLNHGKHVLVEKPMAMNVLETKEMISLAREKKLFLMEGVWSLCFPIYKKMQDEVLNGTIGDLLHVNSNFQIKIGSVDRVFKKVLGGGGILDIGIYAIQFAIWIFHGKKLLNASGDVKFDNDIDLCGTIMLEFENNGTAFLTYHTSLDGDTSAGIYGTKGNIIIPNHMWTPQELIINGKLDQSYKLKRQNESITYNFSNSWCFVYEINHVNECIEKGRLESDLHPLDASLKLAEVMEKLQVKK